MQIPFRANLSYHFGVESGGRLIEEHYIRLHCERTDDGDTLFLTAGKGGGIDICLILKPDSREQFHRFCLRLCANLGGRIGKRKRCFLFFCENIGERDYSVFALCFFVVGYADFYRGKHDIFLDGFIAEKIELLENHAHFSAGEVDIYAVFGEGLFHQATVSLALGIMLFPKEILFLYLHYCIGIAHAGGYELGICFGGADDIKMQIGVNGSEQLAFHPYFSESRMLEQVHATQKRAFSRAGGTDYRYRFTLIYLCGNALEHMERIKILENIFYLKHGISSSFRRL